jgi:hypothetical protein
MSDKPTKPDKTTEELKAELNKPAGDLENLEQPKRDKKDNRARLEELLGPDSTNFLGTGLTMREFLQLTQAEKMAAAWCIQPPEEQKRRRRAVIELSIELGRIRETTNFATRLAELAIESVIEGDWKMVQEWADHFSFDGEGSETQYVPIFATFRELLLQVLRTEEKEPC